MNNHHKYRRLLNIVVVLLLLMPQLATAQETGPNGAPIPTGQDVPVRPELQDPTKPGELVNPDVEEVEDDDFNRKRKYLSLTIGIEYDEKVIGLPSKPTFKGDFKKVASVSIAKGTGVLRFSPRKEGVATLTIHDSSGRMVSEYRIDVKKSDLDKIVREVRSLIGDIEGVQIKVINNRVVVDGQILLPRDMSRIGNVISQYGDKAVSLVSLSPVAQKKIAEIIERDVNNPEVTVRAVNDKFILEGLVADEAERGRVITIAKTYIPDQIIDPAEEKFYKRRNAKEILIDLLRIKEPTPPSPGKIIQMVIHYVELRKNYTKGFRFQWTPDLKDESSVQFGSTSSETGGAITTITGTISNLLPKLNWAKQHDHARVLQSASLIVEDSKKGTLESYASIPFQGIGKDGQTGTMFEKVGLLSNITPRLLGDRSDSIALDLQFSISSLTGITDQGPLTSNANITTNIVVRSGQSAAVGGLITNLNDTGYNRLPKNVSENPLISLYASKDFRRNQSQFVVFITPIIKSSASAGSEKIKQKFRLRD